MLTGFTIFGCLGFAARTLYIARFGFRQMLEQPFHYSVMKRILTATSVLGIALPVIIAVARGEYLFPFACVVASFLISHFVKFGAYRKAATELSDSRMNDGSYVLQGDAIERDKAAMTILDVEVRAGTRQ